MLGVMVGGGVIGLPYVVYTMGLITGNLLPRDGSDCVGYRIESILGNCDSRANIDRSTFRVLSSDWKCRTIRNRIYMFW